jgi:hypothetical protein
VGVERRELRDGCVEPFMPVDAAAVDIYDRAGDPAPVVEIIDGPRASLNAAIVVDDGEPPADAL